jgi:hypothetical protein
MRDYKKILTLNFYFFSVRKVDIELVAMISLPVCLEHFSAFKVFITFWTCKNLFSSEGIKN